MAYIFYHLTDEIRTLMVQELESDKNADNFYLSQNFNETGDSKCFEIAKNEMLYGTEQTFVDALMEHKCFSTKSKSGRTVPKNAAELFAHGEFNRFYIRAICLKAISEQKMVEVYRARPSENPRPESQALIGKIIDPEQLLNDLRKDPFVERAFGLAQPNSGLSVKFEEESEIITL